MRGLNENMVWLSASCRNCPRLSNEMHIEGLAGLKVHTNISYKCSITLPKCAEVFLPCFLSLGSKVLGLLHYGKWEFHYFIWLSELIGVPPHPTKLPTICCIRSATVTPDGSSLTHSTILGGGYDGRRDSYIWMGLPSRSAHCFSRADCMCLCGGEFYCGGDIENAFSKVSLWSVCDSYFAYTP